jgi:N6-adenosine-specific RNA methylase IME4
MCLLGTRGRPRRRSAAVPQLLEAEIREHSRKPETAYERIEQLVDGPYLELFSRSSRPGWTCWGNEVGKFDGLTNSSARAQPEVG